MNRKRKSNCIMLCLAVCFLVVGCKTVQEVTPKATIPKSVDNIENTASALTVPKITSLDYQWVSYRVQLSLKDYTSKKETISATAFFVNKKDSIIYLTLSKLGIEGMRAVITVDSVIFLNHLTSTYYSGNYSLVENLLGFKVDFQILQSIFLGEDFSGFEGKFTHTKTGEINSYNSSSRKNKKMNLTISQIIKTNSEHKMVANNITETNTQASIDVQYSNFMPIEGQPFFHRAEIAVPKENMLLELSLKNVKLNTPGPTSIRIPEKYTPVEIKP